MGATGQAKDARTAVILFYVKHVTWLHCPTRCMGCIQATEYGVREMGEAKNHIPEVHVAGRVDEVEQVFLALVYLRNQASIKVSEQLTRTVHESNFNAFQNNFFLYRT